MASARAHLAPAAAPRARYEVKSETRTAERTVSFIDREQAICTAAAIAEKMRLGKCPELLCVSVDDLRLPPRVQRIFFYEAKVGQ